MPDLLTILDLAAGGLALVLVTRLLSSSRRTSASCPPGPKGLPLIGNVLDMPMEQEWLTFADWATRYGDLMSITLLGQPMVIINSATIASDMLDKKSGIYSDRPFLMMGSELVGWKNALALTPYGARFRSIRRMIHGLMGTRAALSPYVPHIELEGRRFLRRILDAPDDVADATRKTAGAIILNMSHGYQTKEHDDPVVQCVDTATDQFSAATAPGAFLVDVIHSLRHVPSWMPGAGFQRKAASWRSTLERMADVPHAFVKRRMADGTNVPNFTSNHLEQKNISAQEEDTIKWAAASLYSGGADTTVSATNVFFLAMTLHPDAQRKAQAELDAVIGLDTLPTMEDRLRLPYVNALVKEVFRWQPVAPLSVPHRLMSDDMHMGYRIPAGSIVIANIWSMLHCADTYANPMSFNPDRFLGAQPEHDPREICFGFGRRVCPGQQLADASVWLSCALALSSLSIRPIKDSDGNPVLPESVMMSGTISHPKPFKCDITPRSEHARSLIMATAYADDVTA